MNLWSVQEILDAGLSIEMEDHIQLGHDLTDGVAVINVPEALGEWNKPHPDNSTCFLYKCAERSGDTPNTSLPVRELPNGKWVILEKGAETEVVKTQVEEKPKKIAKKEAVKHIEGKNTKTVQVLFHETNMVVVREVYYQDETGALFSYGTEGSKFWCDAGNFEIIEESLDDKEKRIYTLLKDYEYDGSMARDLHMAKYLAKSI